MFSIAVDSTACYVAFLTSPCLVATFQIYELIQPLVERGKLIYRPKATLEHDIDDYYVYTRDNHIVACGQLKLFEDGYAEIGCLVV